MEGKESARIDEEEREDPPRAETRDFSSTETLAFLQVLTISSPVKESVSRFDGVVNGAERGDESEAPS